MRAREEATVQPDQRTSFPRDRFRPLAKTLHRCAPVSASIESSSFHTLCLTAYEPPVGRAFARTAHTLQTRRGANGRADRRRRAPLDERRPRRRPGPRRHGMAARGLHAARAAGRRGRLDADARHGRARAARRGGGAEAAGRAPGHARRRGVAVGQARVVQGAAREGPGPRGGGGAHLPGRQADAPAAHRQGPGLRVLAHGALRRRARRQARQLRRRGGAGRAGRALPAGTQRGAVARGARGLRERRAGQGHRRAGRPGAQADGDAARRVARDGALAASFYSLRVVASASRATSTSRRWRHAPRHRRDAPRSLSRRCC